MNWSWLRTLSIKTRITVFVVGSVYVCMTALSFYVSAMLRGDLKDVLSDQQLSTATLVAADIDRDLRSRIQALERVATDVTPAMLSERSALQAHLQQRHVFLALFNSGVVAYQPDGTAVAELPLETGRVGINYADRDYFLGSLKGQTTVGKPHVSKSKGFAEFMISVPIRASSGQVIGVLAGVTDLSKPNFLDSYVSQRYGDSGGYVVVDAAHRLVVTATDKSRMLEPLPAPGSNPTLDQFVNGHEGTALMQNPKGQQIFAADKGVPSAGWVLAVVLPSAEAFAPIDRLQNRMLVAMLMFTLLAGVVLWWLLKRELAPMLQAVHALSKYSESDQLPQPLPVTRCDEIGKLITGFNQLLGKLSVRELFVQQVFDTASVAIFVIDAQEHLAQVNQRMADMYGTTVQSLLGRDYVSLLRPDMREAGYRNMLALLDNTIDSSNVQRIYCRDDGSEFWGDLTCRSFEDANGNGRFLVCVISDISFSKQAEAELRIAATAFESQQGTTVANAQGLILRVNQAFTQITGYSAAEVVGQNPRVLASGRHDVAFYRAMWDSIALTGAWQGEIWNRRKDGEVYPEWLSVSAVKDAAGVVANYVATFTDITARKSAEDQIKNLAFYDPLTKLPNRRLLLDRLAQALATSARHQTMGALLFVDLDDFKTINETLGHVQGDMLLQSVAQRLCACVREDDTVARLGGDEFVVMLEDLSADAVDAATQAESVGEKIRSALGQSYPLGPFKHHSSPSIGVTLFGGVLPEGVDEPLKRAELAMYQAKQAGRNTLRFFESRMQVVVAERAALEDDLRNALLDNQFLLHYQPQVVGSAGCLIGAEALVRWQHPSRGLVSPAEFIPLAEETGVILALGQWVLEIACRQLAAWAHQPALSQLVLAVNVSAKQFHQDNFVAQVQATLARTGAKPQRLKLELTESLLVSDVEGIIAKMAALKAGGVSFSLDDFGTGYSSLSYLKRLPLDQLKIDQGFVTNILTDTNDAAIAKMVVALAESMGLSVIAEGVELDAQQEFLARLGCHAYQGYYFSRPIPVADFEAFAQRCPSVP
ncbi:MAG: EAL domain-containing protein [Rhodoferax sp.]|nr:EAL domain-containing protein [Rhodoferax sp.]